MLQLRLGGAQAVPELSLSLEEQHKLQLRQQELELKLLATERERDQLQAQLQAARQAAQQAEAASREEKAALYRIVEQVRRLGLPWRRSWRCGAGRALSCTCC